MPNAGPYPQETAPKHFQGSFVLGGGGEPPKTSAPDPDDSTGDAQSLPSEDQKSELFGVLKRSPKQDIPTRREILDRRARKNEQSRRRAAKQKERIIAIEAKDESDRTSEEKELLEEYNLRRQRKNNRSRSRAVEQKEHIERILAKPEDKRTADEVAYLQDKLQARLRKNQGDRMRRQKIKLSKRAESAQQRQMHSQQQQLGSFEEGAEQELLQSQQQIPWPPPPVAL
jgi:hypothetical protein